MQLIANRILIESFKLMLSRYILINDMVNDMFPGIEGK